jgi:lysophospholipase L1-like esterase
VTTASRALWIGVALLAAGCGGASGTPSTPASVAPPTGSNSVAGIVFYDHNGNGAADADERVHLPGVRVAVGGQAGTSDAQGRFSVGGLADGTQSLSVAIDSLPAYFQPGPSPTVTLPAASGTVVPVPVSLPIGRNRPNTYLAFGDSITEGTGSTRKQGWAAPLQDHLRQHWGEAEVIRDGVRSSSSAEGVARLTAALGESRPAFLLVLYGTNDWKKGCQAVAVPDCYTVTALRDIIRIARAAGTQPVIGTIIPAYPDAATAPFNAWVQAQNDLIRAMAQQEGAVLAETWRAFGAEPNLWPPLFYDDLHPNDEGHARIAGAFFEAITRSRGGR